MNALRVVIADDERPARAFLIALLRSFDDVDFVGEASSGEEALAVIEEEKPDLALLDWQLPVLDGMGIVRALKPGEAPLVAFVTAFDEYAVHAFAINALDYLLKPVERKRLRQTLDRARERLRQATLAGQTSRSHMAMHTSGAAHSPFLQRIPVRYHDDIVLVPVGDVASIVAVGARLDITTIGRHRYTINHCLKDLERRLDPSRFVRLGRGCIANIDAIARIHAASGGTHVAVLANGKRLRVSRIQSRALREQLFKV
jgi:two-component system, LytTR family, response regulator